MDKAKKRIVDVLVANVRCKDCPIGGECADSVDYSSECDEMFSHFLFNEPYDCGDEEEETESFADYVCRRFVEDFIGETPWYQEKENTTKTDEKQNGEIMVAVGEMEIKGHPKDVATLMRLMNDENKR